MVDEKTRKQQTLVIAIVAMIAVAGLGYSLYTHYANASTSTLTQLKSNNSGSTASVFQALYINDTDGYSYWVYAPSNYNAMSILGYQTGASTTNTSPVSNVQTCIFITPTLSDNSGVTSWVFQCYATITLVNMQTDKTVGNIVTQTPIEYTAKTLVSGQLQEVVSASSSGTDLQTALNKIGATTTTYAYEVYLTSISMTINFADGTTATLTAPSAMDNVLTWGIQLT